MRKLCAFLLVALGALAQPAFAGEGTGRVIGLIPYASTEELLFVKTEQTSASTPACNTSQRFVLKAGSLYFKTTQAALLAALHAGTEVRVIGAGTCNAWPNSEDIAYVCFGVTPC
jgi:hypothetical protein